MKSRDGCGSEQRALTRLPGFEARLRARELALASQDGPPGPKNRLEPPRSSDLRPAEGTSSRARAAPTRSSVLELISASCALHPQPCCHPPPRPDIAKGAGQRVSLGKLPLLFGFPCWDHVPGVGAFVFNHKEKLITVLCIFSRERSPLNNSGPLSHRRYNNRCAQ